MTSHANLPQFQGRPLFSILEDAVAYTGHGEVCGCPDERKREYWPITLTLSEAQVRWLILVL